MSEQKVMKPILEDAIHEILTGARQKTALDFAAWLRANKMAPAWASGDTWKASYGGTGLYYIKLRYCGWGEEKQYYWTVILYLNHMYEYEETIKNEDLQQFLLDGRFYCYGCNSKKPCLGGKSVTILGKEIKRVCSTALNKVFWQPDDTTISGIKRLLVLEKTARKGSV